MSFCTKEPIKETIYNPTSQMVLQMEVLVGELKGMDYSVLLNNRHLSDVTFVVDGNRFYTHKSILCARSKYFDKLLRGPMTQFSGMELEIEIRDSPVVVYKILQFIYTGSIGDLNAHEDYLLFALLNGSVNYELEPLQLMLEKHIGKKLLTISNVCTVWRLALETGSAQLAEMCEEFFRRNSKMITQLPDFTELMWEPIDLSSFITEVEAIGNMPGDTEFLVRSFLNGDSEHQPNGDAKAVQSIDYAGFGQQPFRGENSPYESLAKSTSIEHQIAETSFKTPFQLDRGLESNAFNDLPQKIEIPHPFLMHQESPSSSISAGQIHVQDSGSARQIVSPNPLQSDQHQIKYSQILALGQVGDTKPPPPSYKMLAAKQKHLPMLQGPIWAKALEKMNTLIDVSRELIGADIGTLFLHDPISNELYSHVAHPEPVDIAIPAHLGIAGACFTTNRCINSPSAYTDTRFYSGIDRQMGAPTLAILAVPVPSVSGKILGVIELLNKKKTTEFSAENEQEVKTVARMVGSIVEQATQEVKTDMEKKNLKRIHMSTNQKESRVKKPRTSIPVFHFKQVGQQL